MNKTNKMLDDISLVIKQAREKSALNQIDFAKSIKKSQGILSKYENGKVSPPADIIIHCMNIIENDEEISSLAAKLKYLSGDKYSKHRQALNLFIDGCIKNVS